MICEVKYCIKLSDFMMDFICVVWKIVDCLNFEVEEIFCMI